jgi:hypothetical protein
MTQQFGGIKIKTLSAWLFIVTLLVLGIGNTAFADTDAVENPPVSNPAANQEPTKQDNPPLWFSFASDGKNQSIGCFGRRMGGEKKEALELVAVVDGENSGYGMDYLRFFNLSDTSAWYLGLGGYSIFEYDYDNYILKTKTHNEIALSVGYQKRIGHFLLGLGVNSVRGINMQIGLSI